MRAARTAGFAQAPGVVTRSELAVSRKGTASLDLEYGFAVNGQSFTGTEYHTGPQIVGNRYWRAAHDALPTGSPVTVYFDPADPNRSLLVPGLRPDSFLVVWVLMPFNLLVVGLIWAAWWGVADRRAFDPALPRCVRATRDGWQVRVSPLTSFAASAFFGLFGIAFAGFFVAAGSTFLLDSTPGWLPLTMYSVALVGAVAIGRHLSQRSLVDVNELEGAISFPRRWNRETVTGERILGLDVATETRKRPRDEGTYEMFVVTLRWRNDLGRDESAKLAEYGERRDADALAGWLSGRLGVSRTPAHAGG